MEHTPIPLPGTLAPAPAVMAILNRFNREEISNAIEVLVGLLDAWDGDPDSEEDDLEDSFVLSRQASESAKGPGCEISDAGGETPYEDQPGPFRALGVWNGPGCPISDPDKGVDDDGEEVAAEDSFQSHLSNGPGCPLADNGIGDQGGLYDAYSADDPKLTWGLDQREVFVRSGRQVKGRSEATAHT